MRPPRAFQRWLLAAFVAWAATGLLVELNETLTAFDRRDEERATPGRWRFGTRAPARLASCLEEVERRVPLGHTISVYSQPGPGEAEFFRWRWASYLLPRHDLIVEDATRGATPRDYLIALQRPIAAPDLIPIYQRPGCVLYRVARVANR